MSNISDAVSKLNKMNENMIIKHGGSVLTEMVNVNNDKQIFDIYQLNDSKEAFDIAFMNLDYIKNHDKKVTVDKYDKIYTGETEPGEDLEEIFERFNRREKPDDYKGHSLSVSDVVVLYDNDKKTAYFVNDIGFEEIPDFFTATESLVKKPRVKNYSPNKKANESYRNNRRYRRIKY